MVRLVSNRLSVGGRVILMKMCLGAIVVSTPQDVALKDAVKGVEMMRKVNVPVRPTAILSNSPRSILMDSTRISS